MERCFFTKGRQVYTMGLLVGLMVSSFTFYHAIYISVLEVQHTDGDKTGNMKVKLFENDLSDAVFNATQTRPIATPSGFEDVEPIGVYFTSKIQLSINGQPLNFKIDSVERLEDSVWLHFQFAAPPIWEEVSLSATYLTELFPTQINVLNLQNGKERRFARLSKGAAEVKFNF